MNLTVCENEKLGQEMLRREKETERERDRNMKGDEQSNRERHTMSDTGVMRQRQGI